MDRLVSLTTKLTGFLAVIATACSSVLMVLICWEVAARTATGGSVPGLVDLSETMLVLIVFLGIAYADITETHVRMTLVTDRIPKRLAALFRVLSYSILTGFTAWMTYHNGRRAWQSFQAGEFRMGLMEWPLWPARWVIVVGLSALTFVFAVKLVFLVIELMGKNRAWTDRTSTPSRATAI